jgi:hypothetical protein
MMGGVAFVNPANPGTYPAKVPGNAVARAQARAEAEHKEYVREYKTFQGVVQTTKDNILETVDHKYLLKIEDEILGFLNQIPTSMLTHLRNQGGALDFADTKTLLAERDGEWDASEVPQLYFNQVKKAIQGLTRAGITSDLNKCQDMALFYLKASGEFNAAIQECKQHKRYVSQMPENLWMPLSRRSMVTSTMTIGISSHVQRYKKTLTLCPQYGQCNTSKISQRGWSQGTRPVSIFTVESRYLAGTPQYLPTCGYMVCHPSFHCL